MIFSVLLVLATCVWDPVDAGIVNLTPCSPSVYRDELLDRPKNSNTYDKSAVYRRRNHRSKDGRTRDNQKPMLSCPFSWPRLPQWPTTTGTAPKSGCSPIPCAVQAGVTAKPRRGSSASRRPIAAVALAHPFARVARPVDQHAQDTLNVPGFEIQLNIRVGPLLVTIGPTTPSTCTTQCEQTRTQPPTTWAPSTSTTTRPTTWAPSTSTTTRPTTWTPSTSTTARPTTSALSTTARPTTFAPPTSTTTRPTTCDPPTSTTTRPTTCDPPTSTTTRPTTCDPPTSTTTRPTTCDPPTSAATRPTTCSPPTSEATRPTTCSPPTTTSTCATTCAGTSPPPPTTLPYGYSSSSRLWPEPWTRYAITPGLTERIWWMMQQSPSRSSVPTARQEVVGKMRPSDVDLGNSVLWSAPVAATAGP